MEIQVGEIVSTVFFNSCGGWNWSQAFRVDAVTANFAAIRAIDEGVCHIQSHNHSMRDGDGFPIGTRFVVDKSQIDDDFVVWGI